MEMIVPLVVHTAAREQHKHAHMHAATHTNPLVIEIDHCIIINSDTDAASMKVSLAAAASVPSSFP